MTNCDPVTVGVWFIVFLSGVGAGLALSTLKYFRGR